MNPVRFVRALPQPLKTLYVLFVLALVATMVAIVLSGGEADWPVPFPGVLGLVVVALGLVLVLDVNGSARALAAQTARERPMGVDYSRSVMARPWFARVFGALALVVGSGFALAGFGVLT